jgi:hypothetical protein
MSFLRNCSLVMIYYFVVISPIGSYLTKKLGNDRKRGKISPSFLTLPQFFFYFSIAVLVFCFLF